MLVPPLLRKSDLSEQSEMKLDGLLTSTSCKMFSRTLLFGPYMGELGHEVRTWAPYVRTLVVRAKKKDIYTRCIAISWLGRNLLYPGCMFMNYDSWKAPNWMMHNPPMLGTMWAKEQYKPDEWYQPEPGGRAALGKYPKTYFRVCKPWKPTRYLKSIVLFARDRQDGVGPDRNYPHWEEVVCQLRDQFPRLNIVSAGLLRGNEHIKGTRDVRVSALSPSLDAARYHIARASLVLGESSGTMHFALAMCGRPVCLICKPSGAKRYTEQDNWWNVPCRVLVAKNFGGVKPSRVVEEVLKF